MEIRIFWVMVLTLFAGVTQAVPVHFDANPANTAAADGTDPWYVEFGTETDTLWEERPGIGFDEAGNNGIYEADAWPN